MLCTVSPSTVDTIAYTIKEGSLRRRFAQAAPGDGGFLKSPTQQFRKLLESKLGEDPGWDYEVLAEALEYFEEVVSTPQQSGWSVFCLWIVNNWNQTDLQKLPHESRQNLERASSRHR